MGEGNNCFVDLLSSAKNLKSLLLSRWGNEYREPYDEDMLLDFLMENVTARALAEIKLCYFQVFSSRLISFLRRHRESLEFLYLTGMRLSLIERWDGVLEFIVGELRLQKCWLSQLGRGPRVPCEMLVLVDEQCRFWYTGEEAVSEGVGNLLKNGVYKTW